MTKRLSQAMTAALVYEISLKINETSLSHKKKKNLSLPTICKALKPLTLELCQCRVAPFFPKLAGSSRQQLQQTRKHSLVVVACPHSQNCAEALLQELGHWLCRQKKL